LEREAEADLKAGRYTEYDSGEEFIQALEDMIVENEANGTYEKEDDNSE
jgi:hypothetical protein